jgi:hypothetical protein
MTCPSLGNLALSGSQPVGLCGVAAASRRAEFVQVLGWIPIGCWLLPGRPRRADCEDPRWGGDELARLFGGQGIDWDGAKNRHGASM